MELGINLNYNYPQTYRSNRQQVKYNTADKYYISFKGLSSNTFSEKGLHKIEYGMRVIGNKIADVFESKKHKLITKYISMIKPEQDKKYLDVLGEISNFYSTNKSIGVNLEDKVLERVAQKGKPVIFIMTHSDQSQDPSMLAFLNLLLVNAYKNAGKENSFPLPKIILNQDILTTMNPTKRKAFEAFGAVGIDANINSADKSANARAFLPLMKDFLRDKCNIFIFPEGRLAIQKFKPLNQRFQIGVAEMVNKILGIKKEVDVVPVGFAYGTGENKIFTGMHIGEPITFKRIGDTTTVTAGEIKNSEYADRGFTDFFAKHNDQTDVVITSNGEPVSTKDSEDLSGKIRELLSENLFVCSKKAEKNITDPLNKDEILQIE